MQYNTRQVVYTVCSLLLAFLLWRHPLIRRSAPPSGPQARSFGRYMAGEVFDRSQSIVYLLAPQANHVQMEADPHQSYVHLRVHRRDLLRHWMVYCTDDNGHDLADLDWNADTGALLQAVPANGQTARCRQGSLGKSQVMAIAQGWLEALKIGGADISWRPARPATCTYGVWSVLWKSGEHHAWVSLRARTGELIEATGW